MFYDEDEVLAGSGAETRAAMLDHYDSLLQMPRGADLDEVQPATQSNMLRLKYINDLPPSCLVIIILCPCFTAMPWMATQHSLSRLIGNWHVIK